MEEMQKEKEGIKLEIGGIYRFASANCPQSKLRHYNYECWIDMQMSNREVPKIGKKTQNGELSIEIMKAMGLLLFKVSIMNNCNSAITIICVGSSLKMQETGGFKIQHG